MAGLNENIMIKLMADTSNYTTKMQAASVQAEKMSTAMEKPRSTAQKLESGFTTAGLAVGALSAAIGVAAVKNFMEFDAAMSLVQANTQASASEMQQLRDAALDAGARTIYSAKESADAINELAKAGMSTTDILNGGLNGALDLAASDGMQVSDAAELMSSALAQFNLTGKDATKVADALAAGAGKAQGSASDLGMALSQSGMVANSFGIGMQETIGTLASFAKAGMIGSDAGTSLKSMLIALAHPSKQAQETLDELGISAYDTQGNFIGLAGLAGQLQTKMSGLTMEQRNAALATIFGSDAVRSANVLYAQGEKGIQQWTKNVSESGYASEQAAARNNNLKGDLEQLSGSFETAFIKIGEAGNGPLRGVIQTITNVVNAFSDLDPHIQQTVVGIGLVVGAAAGLHKVFGNLSTSTSSVKNALGLAVDPMERLKQGLPQLGEGLKTLASAANGTGTGLGSLSGAASRGETAMGGLKKMGSGLVTMMGGPWGIAFAAAAIAITVLANQQQQAQQRAQGYADALQEGTSAAMKLQQAIAKNDDSLSWGWWDQQQSGAETFSDALDKAGISAKTFAQATAGNKTALQEYNAQIDKLKTGTSDQVTLQQHVSTVFDEQKKAIDKSKESAKQQAEVEKEQKKAAVDSTLATAGLTDAQNSNSSSTKELSDAKDILAERMGATSKGINDEAAALGEAYDALKTYYGFAQSAFDADTKLGKSVNDTAEAIKKNGATLDQNTEKGQANREAISGLVDAVQDQAEAYARSGKSAEEVSGVMEKGRQQVVAFAQQMGMTPQDAEAFADSMGLSKSAVDQLVTSVSESGDMKITITDEASQVLDNVKLKAETLPDGKKVTISGDNQDAMNAIAQVVGEKIDPKTGTLTLDPNQYNIALAIANGATIDTKTGYILGNNSDAFNKVAQANGWKIDPKTGVISGDDGKFQAAKKAVESAKIKDKEVKVGANTTSFWDSVNGILGRVFHVNVNASGGKAGGGIVRGPGTGTSDSIPTMLSNGEYVIRAAAVRAVGKEYLDSINYRHFANGGYVAKTEPARMVSTAVPVVSNVSNGEIVRALDEFRNELGPIISAYAPRMGERDLERFVRKKVK